MEWWISDFGDHWCLYCNDNLVATFVDREIALKFSQTFNIRMEKNE